MKYPEVNKLGTILGVWAHPDDETFSMAGIMAAARQNGQRVVCITATRGEAGVQDEKRWPASRLATIRTKELQKAFSLLGVSEHYWLDYPDGLCNKVQFNEAVDRIVAIINKTKPDSLFTFGPDGLTGHDDHRTVSGWAKEALTKSDHKNASIYHAIQTSEQYVHMLEADRSLNVFFNIEKPPICDGCDCGICFQLTEELYELKLQALAAMPSQTEQMLRRFSHVLPQALGVEAFRVYASDV